MARVILAGIVAGVALFVWGILAHTALPLGRMGVSTHPHESMLLPAIQQTTTQPGLYAFPGMDPSKKPTPEEEAEWVERYRTGPHGILVVGPFGQEAMSASRFVSELLTNIVTGVLVAFLLGRLATGVGGFLSGGVLVFLIGWTSLSVPYWNWYGFPAAFTIAEMIDQLVSGAVVGLALGLFLRSKRP